MARTDPSTAINDNHPSQKWLEPLKPRSDYHFSGGKQKYIIYLALSERLDSVFTQGLEQCQALADPLVHEHCFQRDGTRHITMMEVNMTASQALAVHFSPSTSWSDWEIALTGWMP